MKRMLVNANDSEECRIAIVEDGRLQELHVELADRESYLGNIYKGKVVNIEPSIGAAFVSFGGNRNGFLHASDVVASYADPNIGLLDILEGRARLSGEEGPDNVRELLDDEDEEEDGAKETGAGDAPEGPEPGGDATEATTEAAAEAGAATGPAAAAEPASPEEETEPAGAAGGDEIRPADSPDAGDADGDDRPKPPPAASSSAAPDSDDAAGATEKVETGEKSPRRRRRRRRRKSEPGDESGPTGFSDVASSDDEGDDEGDDGTADGDGPEPAGRARVDDLGKTRTRRGHRRDRGNGRRERARVPIQDLVKKGQEVVVQITKEGIGAKGPTLTTYLSLPGRSLVLMPSLPKCGVSRKIDDDRERRRLKRIVRDLDNTGNGGIGFIVRTAGVGKTGQDLSRDLEYLTKLWEVVVERAKVTRAPAPLYVESDLVLRTMRDLFAPDIDEVVVDNAAVYERVRDFVEKLMPRFTDRIKHHAVHAPLFHAYGIEEAVEQLYQPQVDLKHGSSIVIEQTEALVAIDVNSGKYKPGSSLEETAYRTNLEAIPEIVRQLKLRDLGGVVIIDFIDMTDEKHKRQVWRRFRQALRGDRARIKTANEISEFGMLELTRQRVGPGLKRTVFQTCTTCKGTSLVRTVQSKALSVIRAIRALAQLPNYSRLEVYANPQVCEFLANHKRNDFLELENHYRRRIVTVSEPSYPVDAVHYRFLSEDGKEAKVNIPAGLGVHA